MAVDLDVIVDMHARLPPLGEHVGLYGQRFHGRTVELFEQRAPRAWQWAESGCCGIKSMPNRPISLSRVIDSAVSTPIGGWRDSHRAIRRTGRLGRQPYGTTPSGLRKPPRVAGARGAVFV